jgi:hypothetical protein
VSIEMLWHWVDRATRLSYRGTRKSARGLLDPDRVFRFRIAGRASALPWSPAVRAVVGRSSPSLSVLFRFAPGRSLGRPLYADRQGCRHRVVPRSQSDGGKRLAPVITVCRHLWRRYFGTVLVARFAGCSLDHLLRLLLQTELRDSHIGCWVEGGTASSFIAVVFHH